MALQNRLDRKVKKGMAKHSYLNENFDIFLRG